MFEFLLEIEKKIVLIFTLILLTKQFKKRFFNCAKVVNKTFYNNCRHFNEFPNLLQLQYT